MKPFESLVLLPLGAIYTAITQTRVNAYQSGWLPTAKLPVPVISVGNLTTGGTGKTPLVEWVCRVIADEGSATAQRICVLTRGYGRVDAKSQVVVSDGAKLLASARDSGDEPYLLATNLLGKAAVISNPDRYAAGKWAMENLKSDLFLLDDGFQHLRLARTLDIVAIDATNPWGGGHLLPAGRLREKRSGLSRADCVIITRCDQAENVNAIKQEIEQFSGASVFTSRMVTRQIQDLHGHVIDRRALNSMPVAAFCGVGNPQSFFSHLHGENSAPVLTRSFPDHHHYTQTDIDSLCEAAKTHEAKALVTTAKDATKLAALKIDLPCFVLEIEISIDEANRLAEIIRAAVAVRD